MKKENQPISNIQWVDVSLLKSNDYNPNVVFSEELKLLLFSIQTNGWIQPILCTNDFVIIDGFHRATLAKKFSVITVDGKVPCVLMEMTEPERMMLTIRINRAKGSHIAFKMHDVVQRLVDDFDLSIETIAHNIGATKEEVELLLQENIFQKKGISETSQYSKAWVTE